jgi:hypothetical protein
MLGFFQYQQMGSQVDNYVYQRSLKMPQKLSFLHHLYPLSFQALI